MTTANKRLQLRKLLAEVYSDAIERNEEIANDLNKICWTMREDKLDLAISKAQEDVNELRSKDIWK